MELREIRKTGGLMSHFGQGGVLARERSLRPVEAQPGLVVLLVENAYPLTLRLQLPLEASRLGAFGVSGRPERSRDKECGQRDDDPDAHAEPPTGIRAGTRCEGLHNGANPTPARR